VTYPETETIETPELSKMDLYPAGRPLKSSTYRTPQCYGIVMPNVIYYPAQGVILDDRRRAIEDPHQVPMRKHWYDWKPFFSRNIEEISGSSFVFRSFCHNIYHLLTDHLPALFMLGELPWERQDRIKLLLTPPLSKLEKHLVPRLCPDQVEIMEIRGDRLYRLERCYYVSQLPYRGCGFLPDFYLRRFLDRVAPKRSRRRNRRIYISRSMSASRRILNEDQLVGGLRRLGFDSYSLENLTITDQINLFHDAEMVVAAHGAGLVNLLYAENAKVLELFPGPMVRPHYYFLCKSRGHEYDYLKTKQSSSFPTRFLHEFEESFRGSKRDFSVDCEQVIRKVEAMLL
jgi:hypothetical protein